MLTPKQLKISEALCDMLSEINAHPRDASVAMIHIAACNAASHNVDDRKEVAELYARVWQAAYSETH